MLIVIDNFSEEEMFVSVTEINYEFKDNEPTNDLQIVPEPQLQIIEINQEL